MTMPVDDDLQEIIDGLQQRGSRVWTRYRVLLAALYRENTGVVLDASVSSMNEAVLVVTERIRWNRDVWLREELDAPD